MQRREPLLKMEAGIPIVTSTIKWLILKHCESYLYSQAASATLSAL